MSVVVGDPPSRPERLQPQYIERNDGRYCAGCGQPRTKRAKLMELLPLAGGFTTWFVFAVFGPQIFGVNPTTNQVLLNLIGQEIGQSYQTYYTIGILSFPLLTAVAAALWLGRVRQAYRDHKYVFRRRF